MLESGRMVSDGSTDSAAEIDGWASHGTRLAGHVLHGVADTVVHLTREWRAAHRYAALFGLFFVVGLIALLVTAFDPQPFPGSWWSYGSWTSVSGLVTGLSRWSGRQPGPP